LRVERIRGDFPPLAKYTYLDSASTGLIPKTSYEAVKSFIDEYYSEGENWDYVLESVVECRRLFSSLIGAEFKEIAILPNVSTALSLVALSINFKKNDNVVAASSNFPTNLDIWFSLRRRGLFKEVRLAEGLEDDIEKLIDDETKVVSIDAVGWLRGYAYDLKRLAAKAHEHGALFISDIFHAAGVIPLDLHRLDIDIAMCGSYKWLNAPPGAAFLYVKEELLDKLAPPVLGWMGTRDSVINRMLRGEPLFESMFDAENPEPSGDASRYELGTWPSITVIGLRASLQYHLNLDEAEKHRHVTSLATYTREQLKEMKLEIIDEQNPQVSGIVSFKAEKPLILAENLKRAGIVVSARPGLVRISHHFYNSYADVEKLLTALKKRQTK